ncbi:MAG TPA: MogA/MoaB family molybdenum cofactor biosynthesis protein [Desulfurella acetivorans]|uniref:MogA/MoaB family molybdenum cofactor biosynthesis protein n=1 Tax=Desulfurella acetivorans TaxID=33002 RepID=A0A7C6E910_DESAE|nr:MogA/MoaB family molybdenum cofactor biosynthesis protein [Desulfurella acetivorans]
MKFAVITLSDKGYKKERDDLTGPALIDFIQKNLNEMELAYYTVIPDDKEMLKRELIELSDNSIDLIVTNGSTGIAPRDIAPDVTLELIEKRLYGFEEVMRIKSFEKTPTAIVSRACVGTRKNSLIINVPGSPKAAIENISVVLGAILHTIKKLQGDDTPCASV